jgi:hypothetical protein
MESLGVSGIVNYPTDIVRKYNALLHQIGADGMLLQVERFLDLEEITDLITSIEDNLIENCIEPSSLA